jgi:hypothetical protein
MDRRLEARHMRGLGFAAIPERPRRTDELDPCADPHDMPGQAVPGDRSGEPVFEPRGQPFHMRVVFLGHHGLEGGTHGGELQRIGRKQPQPAISMTPQSPDSLPKAMRRSSLSHIIEVTAPLPGRRSSTSFWSAKRTAITMPSA